MSDYVNTTVGIWDKLYRITVPVIGSKSPQELKMHGVFHTGIKSIDFEHSREMHHRWATINDMVELYKDGVAILIPDESDVKKIYDAIVLHLKAWKEKLDTGINTGKAPLDDLMLLDDFAMSISQEAKHVKLFTTEEENLKNHIFPDDGLGALYSESVNKVKVNLLRTPTGIQDEEPRHESLADFLKEVSFNAKRNYRR